MALKKFSFLSSYDSFFEWNIFKRKKSCSLTSNLVTLLFSFLLFRLELNIKKIAEILCVTILIYLFFCLSAFRQSLVGSKLHLIMFHTFFFLLFAKQSKKHLNERRGRKKIIRHNYECLTMRYIHIHDLFFLCCVFFINM